MEGQMTIDQYIESLFDALHAGDVMRTHGKELSFTDLGKKVGEKVLVRNVGSGMEWIVGEVRAVMPSLKGDDLKAVIFTGDTIHTFFEAEAGKGRNLICEVR